MEAVAEARRALPPGGEVPKDYASAALDDGAVTRVKLSELFIPETDALAVYNYMFPRHAGDQRPGPTTVRAPSFRLPRVPARRAPL
jgi:predicted dithiol-disulfide oxidoreductase (DUF899 family)